MLDMWEMVNTQAAENNVKIDCSEGNLVCSQSRPLLCYTFLVSDLPESKRSFI